MKGQPKDHQVGALAGINYSTRIWKDAQSQNQDSFRAIDKGLVSLQGQLIFLLTRKKTVWQFGLGYQEAGFIRMFNNMGYGDSIHPEFPRFADHVQGDPRHVHLTYKFRYLHLPVMINYEIVSLRKSISLKYYFTAGASLGYLLSDKTIANTKGFALEAKTRFVLNNAYPSNAFQAHVYLGGRVEYLMNGRFRFQFQPLISMPVLSALQSPYMLWTPSIQANIGLSIPLDKIGKKEGEE